MSNHLGEMKKYVFYGEGETHSMQRIIRFCDDKSCDEILKRLGEDRTTVKIKYERQSEKTKKVNHIDWNNLPKLTINPPHPELIVKFQNQQKLEQFYTDILKKPYKYERGIFYPEKPYPYQLNAYWKSNLPEERIKNKYPLFVISKGRYQPDRSLTHNWFCKNKIHHFMIVECCEEDNYRQNMTNEYTTILKLPPSYDNLGKGSIPVRNWIDDYARMCMKVEKYWCIDDNIISFYRWEKNTRRQIVDTTAFRVCEDFADRYDNLFMSGLQYKSFLPEISRARTLAVKNTRIYSCILISTKLKFILDGTLWRGMYNEDTDLSLRLLKKGYPTVLHQQFLCDKSTTNSVKGGNTSSIYKDDGLQRKLESLINQHPDVVKGTIKFKKVHHQVDYRPFKNNKLIMKDNLDIPEVENDYGLEIHDN
tara:strand:+ start:264 stop:1526 length:1263 start_codon:yes stop_codon:yes gene_type:complete